MIITKKNLMALFNCGAPNSAQLTLLGLPPYPLKKGWMKKAIGKEISDDLYRTLMSLKGRKPRGAKRKEWRKGEVVMEESAQYGKTTTNHSVN
jgi:hypothetical protein